MGFLFKSAIGLGAVYFAMFSPTLRSQEVGSATSLCASAASQQLAGEAGFSAQMSATGCAAAVVTLAQRRAPAPPAKSPQIKLPQAHSPQAKLPAGTLTAADLAEPWFGPGRPLRKTAGRG